MIVTIPYIKEKLDDPEMYQTVYSKEVGSAAAPTAGLHFTEELLAKIEAKGVKLVYLTLHVGLGTFRPVSVDNIEEHKMHSEFYRLSEEAAETGPHRPERCPASHRQHGAHAHGGDRDLRRPPHHPGGTAAGN